MINPPDLKSIKICQIVLSIITLNYSKHMPYPNNRGVIFMDTV